MRSNRSYRHLVSSQSGAAGLEPARWRDQSAEGTVELSLQQNHALGGTSSVTDNREATVSIRWLIPFMRVTGDAPGDIALLRSEGITLEGFAHPDTRIGHRAVMELLAASVAQHSDPCLGLRAGELFEPSDLGVLDYAARNCSNLREAILCCGRYMYLMHTAQESRLIEQDQLAIWQLHTTDDVEQQPAANDFALASAVGFARHRTGLRSPLREVHLRHAAQTCPAGYARMFGDAEIKLGMPCNAIVFDRAQLYLPMVLAHSGLQAAFEVHASALLERLRGPATLAGRARELVLEQLRGRRCSMPALARRLGLSEPALRRRLEKEGTSFSQLLGEVRYTLALQYLSDRSLAISQIAFLLGFSNVSAFYKSFRRRSSGATPAQYREQIWIKKLSAD
jgi:AraC-like DNA-binding protein